MIYGLGMEPFITGLFGIVIILLFSYLYNRRRHRFPIHPVSSKGLISNTIMTLDNYQQLLHVYKDSLDIVKGREKDFPYGAIFYTPFLFKSFLRVCDYKLARIILLGDKTLGIEPGIKRTPIAGFNFPHPTATNLFTAISLDPLREKARKFLAPVFSTTNLSQTTTGLYKSMEETFQIFDESSMNSSVLEMNDQILHLFIKTITRAAFNVEFSIGPKEGAIDAIEYLKQENIAIREGVRISFIPLYRYIFWLPNAIEGRKAREWLTNTGRDILEIYKRSHPDALAAESAVSSEEGFGEHIISRLLGFDYPTENHRLSDLLIFILAGHETSAYTFAFFLIDMINHPIQRAKLQRELDAEINNEKCENGRPKVSQVFKMEYLSACLKESMRMNPVSGVGSARVITQDIEYNGMTVPKGTTAFLSFHAMFRQSWIDRPDEFIPERWEENAPQAKELREMLMPFSLGPRGCIGMNMANMQLKLLAANFMRYYDFELVDKDIQLEGGLAIRPKSLKMKVSPRK